MIGARTNSADIGSVTEGSPVCLILDMSQTELAIPIITTTEELSRFRQQQTMMFACSNGTNIGFIIEWNPARLDYSLPQTELAIPIITTTEELSRFRQQ